MPVWTVGVWCPTLPACWNGIALSKMQQLFDVFLLNWQYTSRWFGRSWSATAVQSSCAAALSPSLLSFGQHWAVHLVFNCCMHLLSCAHAGLLSLGWGDGAIVFSLRTSLSDSHSLLLSLWFWLRQWCVRHRRHRPIYRTPVKISKLRRSCRQKTSRYCPTAWVKNISYTCWWLTGCSPCITPRRQVQCMYRPTYESEAKLQSPF
jgi:hypothetical protein